MGKRVRISNDRLNSYGTRVLTSGMDTEQYSRNPVLLYMHERGNVIGYVKDLEVKDGEVTGELMFDEATELSKRCKKQFEFGSLKMVSAGLDIIEMSEDGQYLVEGQTSPTITKSKLFEVSVVDIGANDDAIVLKKDGKQITLGRDGACPLPLLNNNNNHQKREEMENKTIALQLGLPETATEAEITAKLTSLKSAEAEKSKLELEKAQLELEKAQLEQARITALVERAIGEKRLGESNKEEFINLGKKVGYEELEKVLKAMQPQAKLTAILNGGRAKEGEDVKYTKLSEVPSTEILALREQNPKEYARLYKAEYGMDLPE